MKKIKILLLCLIVSITSYSQDWRITSDASMYYGKEYQSNIPLEINIIDYVLSDFTIAEKLRCNVIDVKAYSLNNHNLIEYRGLTMIKDIYVRVSFFIHKKYYKLVIYAKERDIIFFMER